MREKEKGWWRRRFILKNVEEESSEGELLYSKDTEYNHGDELEIYILNMKLKEKWSYSIFSSQLSSPLLFPPFLSFSFLSNLLLLYSVLFYSNAASPSRWQYDTISSTICYLQTPSRKKPLKGRFNRNTYGRSDIYCHSTRLSLLTCTTSSRSRKSEAMTLSLSFSSEVFKAWDIIEHREKN